MIEIQHLDLNIGIYGLRNIVDGKWYIGQSYNLATRKKHHLSRLNNGHHHNHHLQNAISQHGINNFEFVIIEQVPKDIIDERERFWIAHYRSSERDFGYNKEIGGRAYKTVSEETRQKLSLIGKQPRSQKQLDHLKRLHASMLGRPNGRKGIKLSQEWRDKLSLAKKGKPRGPMPLAIRLAISTAKKGNNGLRGRKYSASHRLALSMAKQGSKNPMWKGMQ